MAESPEIAALWREVAAHPHDNGLRAVLADALQAAGDPRGELIALQLLPSDDDEAPERARRIQALLAEHGDRWLGAAAPICRAAHFDRGVLDRFELEYPWPEDRPWRRLLEDPPLATVEDLLPGRVAPNLDIYARLIASPKLHRLRRVDATHVVWIDELDERIEHVAFRRTAQFSTASERLIERLDDLPRITSLAIAASDFDRFARARWFDRIEHLSIASAVGTGLALWHRLPEHMTFAIVSYTGLTTCSLAYPWDYRIELVRDGDDLVARISGEWLLAAMDGLAGLPPTVTRIEIEHTSDATAKRLHAVVEHHGAPVTVRRASWHGNLVRDAQFAPRRPS